jgi:hypothetical protein
MAKEIFRPYSRSLATKLLTGMKLHMIDRILVECLGWPKEPDKFKVEVHTDGDYQDYVLGWPRVAIWEAKRSGIYFDFPADADKKSTQTISDLFWDLYITVT